MNQFFRMMLLLCGALGRCSHVACQKEEGSYDCLDCGQPVVSRWVQYRCVECHRVRPAVRLFGQGVLCDARCDCGAVETWVRVVERPNYFCLEGAVLLSQLQYPQGWCERLEGRPILPDLSKTRVWIKASPSV